MVTTPAELPVTTPVDGLITARVGFELDHVPPEVAFVIVT
jgi:hypothetical protein